MLEANQMTSTLNLVFDLGVDVNGKSVNRNRAFSNVKAIATDQAIWDTALAITGLQSKPVISVVVVDKTALILM